MSKQHVGDQHFKHFVEDLQVFLHKHKDPMGRDRTTLQKDHLELLVDLERQFRKSLVKTIEGREVYKKFVKYIMDERKTLLNARPFFRERQDMFKEAISPALRAREDRALYQYDINYMFVDFALRNAKFPSNSVPLRLAKEIAAVRKELIETNTPLAISRAKIFFRSTPKSHTEYMDLVQSSVMGLITAIDKFCLPYTPVFRSVAIGRGVGNMIDVYSSTMLYFNSADRKKLYRANKARSRGGSDRSPDELARAVNMGPGTKYDKTNPDEIVGILSASSHVSIETPSNNDFELEGGGDPVSEKYAAPVGIQPDQMVEEADLKWELSKAIKTLSIFEQKLLKLKGLEFEITNYKE
jgi:RNA polymerase sigma factor (sigma-70 family)